MPRPIRHHSVFSRRVRKVLGMDEDVTNLRFEGAESGVEYVNFNDNIHLRFGHSNDRALFFDATDLILQTLAADTGSALKLDVNGNGVALEIDTEATTANVIDIAGDTITTGKVVDISDLDAITTGKAIHIDATGITQTTGILVHIDSASTALTGAGRLLLVDSTGDFNDAAGIVAEIQTVHTTGVGLLLTMDAITDGFGVDGTFDALTSGEAVRIVSSSTGLTTNGRLLHVHASGDFDDAGGVVVEIESAHTTGEALQIVADAMTDGFGQRVTADAITTGTALIIESTSTTQTTGKLLDLDTTVSGDTISDRTGAIATIDVSRTDTRTSGTTADDFDVLAITRTNIMNGAGGTMTAAGSVARLENVATQTAGTLTDSVNVLELVQDADSTGNSLNINHDAAGGQAAVNLDVDANHATNDAIAVAVDVDNADAGDQVAFNVTMVDEAKSYLLKLANATTGWTSTKNPETDAEDGWLKIDVNGTAFFIPYYAAA